MKKLIINSKIDVLKKLKEILWDYDECNFKIGETKLKELIKNIHSAKELNQRGKSANETN